MCLFFSPEKNGKPIVNRVWFCNYLVISKIMVIFVNFFTNNKKGYDKKTHDSMFRHAGIDGDG